MAPTPEQARIVAGLKSGALREGPIQIRSTPAGMKGYLVPITSELAQDTAVIDAVYRWRRAHVTAFLTVFDPTPEKTRDYLRNFSLPDAARILFLIADPDGRFVGHIGLCNIAASGAEIDNVVRGEPVASPDFMVLAHHAILAWAFARLDIPLAFLNVLAHNERALQTYRKAGFREVLRVPLVREERDDGYRLTPAAGPKDAETAATLVRMELLRSEFHRQRAR